MAYPASASLLGAEFDNFLFAPIEEDRNGMLLSVISALTRLNLDPWQEAVKLADLPGKAATARLASLIAELPKGPSAQRDSGTIAVRLIALLPHKAPPNLTLGGTSLTFPKIINSNAVMVVVFAVMALALVSVWIAAGMQSSARIGGIGAPAASTVSPQAAPIPPTL